MIRFSKQAIKDIRQNGFLNTVCIIIISLSVFIVSGFGLFFENINDVMKTWEKGVRIMVYLKKEFSEDALDDLKNKILQLHSVESARFISKKEALSLLKEQMRHQSSLLENLSENPLPDALEVRMTTESQSINTIETTAKLIQSIPLVEDVEYGQQWYGRFVHVFQLFRLAGYGVSCLFFMATAFIIANTIRIILYSRREEIEIMRLVGATNAFIKGPIYIEGLIQGAIGGMIGILFLLGVSALVSSRLAQGFPSVFFHIRFFSITTVLGIVLCSMATGWLGCYLSLRQFLKA
jgi:cell division transport system permease protein